MMGAVDEQTANLINAAVEALQLPSPRLVVKGRISLQETGPLPTLIVKAFDKDLRSEELLGEATTGQSQAGGYEIRYTADQFRRAEKKGADLIVRVFARSGAVLGESNIIFNATAIEEVNLSVALPTQPLLSEFEKLLAALSPVLRKTYNLPT